MPNNLPKIALGHGSKATFFLFKVHQAISKHFSVASNIVLWKDLCLLSHLLISLPLVATYLAVCPCSLRRPMLKLMLSF